MFLVPQEFVSRRKVRTTINHRERLQSPLSQMRNWTFGEVMERAQNNSAMLILHDLAILLEMTILVDRQMVRPASSKTWVWNPVLQDGFALTLEYQARKPSGWYRTLKTMLRGFLPKMLGKVKSKSKHQVLKAFCRHRTVGHTGSGFWNGAKVCGLCVRQYIVSITMVCDGEWSRNLDREV